MHLRFVRLIFGFITAFALSACSANHNSIYRTKLLTNDRDTIMTVDAKQRAILTRVAEGAKGDPAKIRRFCSEPSPDVFSVIAQSFAGGGSFGKSADPTNVQIALQLAMSSAETGSTIPRTQTINMLRELMFRTCERYLSGGYDEMELSVQAVRDQRLMVSILAIEQLTGAVVPNPVMLRAGGSAGAGLGGEAIQIFAKLREQKQKADGEAAAALTAYNARFGKDDAGKDKDCSAAVGAATPNDEQKKILGECKELQSKKESTSAAAKEADEAYSAVRKAVDTGGVSASTVTAAIANGGLTRASPGSINNVASAVKDIVEMNFSDQTETMLFCLRSLRTMNDFDLSDPQKDRLAEQCLAYLEKDIQLATAKVQVNLDNLVGFNASSFELFRQKVTVNGKGQIIDAGRLTWLLQQRLPQQRSSRIDSAVQSLLAADTIDDLRVAFGMLPQPFRLRLAQ